MCDIRAWYKEQKPNKVVACLLDVVSEQRTATMEHKTNTAGI
jgi:hypothetical protein